MCPLKNKSNYMKTKTFLSVLLIFFGWVALSQPKNEWEDPSVIERKKEGPHASFMVYDNVEHARIDDYKNSQYYMSLNGSWKFQLANKPADRIEDF